MKNENSRSGVHYAIGSFFVVIGIEFLFAWACLYAKIDPLNQSDIVWYGISIVLSFLIFPLSYRALKKCGLEKMFPANPKREKVSFWVTSLILLGGVILLFWHSPEAFASYVWAGHSGKYTGYFTIALLCVATVYLLVSGGIKPKESAPGVDVFPFVCALLVAFTFAANYRLDSFTSHYNTHHFDAWFHSVYRVMHFQPYSDVNVGVYGHYGILFAPWIALLGGDLNATMLVVSVLSATSLFCCLYVLNELVKAPWLKVIAAIALASVYLNVGSFYVQNYPTRLMFPSFLLAAMIWQDKHHKETGIWKYVSCAIVVLALVNNTETGIGCLLALLGANIVRLLQYPPIHPSKLWVGILKNILLGAVLFLVSLLVVDIYNLLAGGSPLSLGTYLFPIIGSNTSANYMNAIYYPLSLMPSWWMAVCCLIYGLIGYVLMGTVLCTSPAKGRPRDAHIAAITILIAVLVSYFMNRSAFGNLLLALPFISIMLAYIAELPAPLHDGEPYRCGHGIIGGVCIISIVLLVLFAEITVCDFFPVEQGRAAARDRAVLNDLVQQAEQVVEPDTFAVGSGLPALYAELGWDTGYYGPDGADFFAPSEEGMREIYHRIATEDRLLVTEAILNTAREDAPEQFEDWEDTHTLHAVIQSGAVKYLYFGRGALFLGSGSQDDPYQITSARDLNLLAQSVNAGSTYDGCWFRQNCDLDLADYENWTPIGIYDCEYAFSGIYDGDGHTISNLNITNGGNAGLFGKLAGTVCNLGIESGHISGNCIGSIASHSSGDNAMIVNCYNKASLSTLPWWGRCGGIADNFGNGKIICCVNSGTMETTTEGAVSAGICSYTAGEIWGCISNIDPTVEEYFLGTQTSITIDTAASPEMLNDMLAEAGGLPELEGIPLKQW